MSKIFHHSYEGYQEEEEKEEEGVFLHSNNDKTASSALRRQEEHGDLCRGCCVHVRSGLKGISQKETATFSSFYWFETVGALLPGNAPPPHLQGSMERASQSEDTLSSIALENIKNKLIRAFRVTAEAREEPQESGCSVRPVSMSRSHQANEELRRAKIDGAITWIRSELVSCCRFPSSRSGTLFVFFNGKSSAKVPSFVCFCILHRRLLILAAFLQQDMRTQDLQLAQTLLGLNMEIQRLRRESFGGFEADGDDSQ